MLMVTIKTALHTFFAHPKLYPKVGKIRPNKRTGETRGLIIRSVIYNASCWLSFSFSRQRSMETERAEGLPVSLI